MATSLSDLERTVLVVREWVDAHKTIPIAPLPSTALISAIKLIRHKSRIPDENRNSKKACIASEYNPESEDLETCSLRLKTKLLMDQFD